MATPATGYTREELEKLISSTLEASYAPQREALQRQQAAYEAELEAAARLASANLDTTRQQLESRRARDIEELLASAERAQLRSGGYNSALSQRYERGQADLMAHYGDALSAAEREYNALLENNAAARAAYSRQIAEQLSQLTAQQQRDYAARLLQMEYEQRSADLAFQREKEMLAYQNSLRGSSGGGKGSGVPIDQYIEQDRIAAEAARIADIYQTAQANATDRINDLLKRVERAQQQPPQKAAAGVVRKPATSRGGGSWYRTTK